MGLITGDRRSASVRSLRDSFLFRLSKEHFERLLTLHPALMRRIACGLSERLKHSNARASSVRQRLRTFAVFPAGRLASTSDFTDKLTRSLNEIAPTRCITNAMAEEALG